MPENVCRSLLKLCLAIGVLAAMLVPAGAGGAEPADDLPDPLDRGPYLAERLDPFKAGLFSYQEPNVGGGATTGNSEPVTFQIRGSAFVPVGKTGKSPILVFVHGNHGSCDSGGGSAPNCTIFKRNDSGYAYMAENLASWGYSVFSLDQDQLMSRQDGVGKGMHARRLLISALLDSLFKANEVGLPTEAQDANFTIGKSLLGKLDFTRIGLMGHSRGGDAVSSFVDWNRMRPSGRRYPLRGVISLAPTNYERAATYGVPFMAIGPWCDGDVSNLQSARIYERSQHVAGENPYPTIHSSQMGGNHNWYNTVWKADGDDANGSDPACNTTAANSIRLSGSAGPDLSENYVIDNTAKLDPTLNTRISGDPSRMGDQEKIGLATMGAFFRRYVGGEGAFEPYLTGELNEEGRPQIPLSACPASASGKRMPCIERVSNSFFAPSAERLDVIGPESENPLALSSLGTKLSSSGFSNPYLPGGGVSPQPATTASGIDWCNPEPIHTIPSQLGISGLPTSARPCPLPASTEVGKQADVREDAPVNHSYGRQLALAWDDPVATDGAPATVGTTIPAALGDLSSFKALAMGADVNFFDPRNPARTTAAMSDPSLTTQDFEIALIDADGEEGIVSAAEQRYGNALHQTTGNSTEAVHIVLDEIRVPLEDFAVQGVDLTAVRELELRFGGEGMPKTGSIQLADVRFQEAADGTDVLLDSTEPDAGPGEGEPDEGPNPVAEMSLFDRTAIGMQLPDVTRERGSGVWTVDDDKVDCPSAGFTSIQAAVTQAAPWDTIVICPGLYEESSTPVNHANNPVQSGAKNGLTITKPLKIKGAGADKVTIRPAASTPGGTLAGTAPYLRDGGGNVITISRQSFGSTDDPEMFVDISGVTVDSPSVYAEAGIAFFDSAGRVSDSVVGPLKTAADGTELAAKPHGWGIVASNHLRGSGPGTALRRITIDDSKVLGYQSGGILFDDARGTDGNAANLEPSGIRIAGYVNDTIVEGGASAVFPQTGIQYHAGAFGFIEKTKVANNLFTTDQRKSVGVLLTGAETGSWYAKGSLLAGNGYGLFNADITNTTVSAAAPALATGNYWGTGGSPIKAPTEFIAPSTIKEGISPDTAVPAASVTATSALSSAPSTIAAPGDVADLAPLGSIVNPGDSEEFEAGEPVEPVVLADDDFGVKAVSLTADGEPVASIEESPYSFEWTPLEEQQGETVTLEATIEDSSGQTVTSSIEVEVAEKAAEPPAEEPPVEKPVIEEPPAKAPAAPAATPSSEFWLGKVVRNTKTGTALFEVDLSGPGKLALAGPSVKAVTQEAATSGTVKVAVQATGAAKKALNRKGGAKVRLEFTFTASGGGPATKAETVFLVKKKP